MVFYSKWISTAAPTLLAVALLLGCPRVGRAAGTWSVISLPQKPNELIELRAVAVDAAGTLYIADGQRVQHRDTQGNWSVIANWSGRAGGTDLGRELGAPRGRPRWYRCGSSIEPRLHAADAWRL